MARLTYCPYCGGGVVEVVVSNEAGTWKAVAASWCVLCGAWVRRPRYLPSVTGCTSASSYVPLP